MPTLLVAKGDGTVRSHVDLADRRKLTIGRSTRCDLRLRAPSISRRHALLFEHDGAWHLVDTGSTMGIFRGARQWQHLLLLPEQWARIGPAYLWLESDDDTAASGEDLVTFDRDPSDGVPPRGSARSSRTVVEKPIGDDAAVLHLADAGAGKLRRILLPDDEDVLTLGRHPACDVVLQDPEAGAIQAVLYTEHSGWCLAHAGRPRTTRVEGRPTWRVRMGENRIVRIGGSMLWIDDVSSDTGDEAEETLVGAAPPAAGETATTPVSGPAGWSAVGGEVEGSVFFDDPDDRFPTD